MYTTGHRAEARPLTFLSKQNVRTESKGIVHCNSFPFMYSQKRFSQVSLLIIAINSSNTVFSQNYDILQRSTVILFMHLHVFSCKHKGTTYFRTEYEIKSSTEVQCSNVVGIAFETISGSQAAFSFWNILKVIFCSRKARIRCEQGFGKDFQYK